MGAEPWSYFVPYEPDAESVMEKLKNQVFESGEYFPRTLPRFGGGEGAPPFLLDIQEKARAQYEAMFAGNPIPETIDEAREIADADGTKSILDMDAIADEPDDGVVVPLSDAQLTELFGTNQPTHAMLEGSGKVYDGIERGQGVYTVVYDQGEPSELFFAGYSYD